MININNFAKNMVSNKYEAVKSIDGSMSVSVMECYSHLVSLGKITGHSYLRVFGRNADIDANQEEDLWTLGGTYNYAISGETLFASSSSTSDTNKRIILTGLDENLNIITGSCVLNGQNVVQITGNTLPFYRINSIVGDNLLTAFVGQVYVYPTTTVSNGVPNPLTVVRGHIEIGATREFKTAYTIPNGYTFMLHKIVSNTSRSSDISIIFKSRLWDSVNKFQKALNISSINNVGENVYQLDYLSPIVFQQKSELIISINSLTANSKMATTLEGYLIENRYI